MIRAGVIAASTLLLAAAFATRASDRRSTCPAPLVPAYLGPDGLSRLASHAPLHWSLVVNPHNGPGAAPDERYRDAIAAARAAGARVLGYVATAWGARPAAAVQAEAEHYLAWYGVDGIFLDEAAADKAALPHYRALAAGARAAGAGAIAINPGMVPARGYFDIADVVVTFEGPFAAYSARREPQWLARVDSQRIAHLVYGAPRGTARGRVYMTPGEPPNPWATVPLPAEACA